MFENGWETLLYSVKYGNKDVFKLFKIMALLTIKLFILCYLVE